MPYCIKCGVELDSSIKECPLCHYNLPPISEEPDKDEYLKEPVFHFPKPENIYPGRLLDLKKKTFQAISGMTLLNIILLALFFLKSKTDFTSFLYLSAIILSLWFYLLLFFDFIPNRKLMIASLIGNTFLFTFLMDLMNGRLEWFLPVFVPGTVWASIVLITTAAVIRIRKMRSKSLILLIAFAISVFLIGLELILTRYLLKKITFFWSIILSGELMAFALLLLFFYHNVPAKIKNKLKKKMHI